MSDSSRTEQIGRLLDDYLDRLRQGQKPDINDYIQQHPALAVEIRETFSALMMLQNIERAADYIQPGVDSKSASAETGTPPQRIGDFVIVREIGRGGMGVVYEAIQESLSRRVALKILLLPQHRPAKLVERFQREARAVASLHHNHIIPVFAVGQQNEVSFFAMQFIEGIGVDELIRRLRDSATPDIRHEISLIGSDTIRSRVIERNPQSPDLLAETVECTRPNIANNQPDPNCDTPQIAVGDFEGPSGLSSSDPANATHYRKIAQVGLLVADALQHAHDRGILHRDIKPSNLMIDRQGTVWVADFGLAKVHETDLTQTGDIVGTLQYLPPERLKGVEGETGDIFSLGLTLYELITLTPAYFGASQADLIAQILKCTPRRIREINSRVPRDLETIVHKAMALEPGMRYASAKLMAEDLDCFLTGRPIRARPTGLLGRTALWARRNPVPAGLLSLVCVLTMALLVGSLFAAIRFAHDNQLITDHLNRSIGAEREKGIALLESKISQATALLESTTMGRAKAIKEAVSEAVVLSKELELVAENESVLRQIGFNLSGLMDIEEGKAVPLGDYDSPQKQDAAFDSTLTRIARCHVDGDILIEDLNDSTSSFRLSGFWNTDLPANHPFLLFSPDDSMLGVRGVAQDGRLLVQVWSLDDQTLLLEQEANGNYLDTAITFVGNEQIAFAADGNTVLLVEIRTGALLWKSEPLQTRIQWLASDRIGDVLIGSADVFLLNGKSGKLRGQFANPSSSISCAINPLGRYFAVSYGDGEILVWDLSDFRKPVFSLKGHSQRVVSLSFHPQENLLLSSSIDGTTRLWDTVVARPILVAPFGGIRFNRSGTKIGFHAPQNRYGIWDLVGLDQKILANGHLRESTIRSLDFSPDSQIIGWASEYLGIVLAETAIPNTQRIFDGYQSATFFAFSNSDTDKIVSAGFPSIDQFGYSRHSDQASQASLSAIREQSLVHDLHHAPVGRQLPDGSFLVTDGHGPLLHFKLDEPLTALELPYPANQFAVDRGGKQLAFVSPQNAGVTIWSLDEEKTVVELQDGIEGRVVVEFDPQNRWLAVSGQGKMLLFETETWKLSHSIAAVDSTLTGHCAFSPDGRLLAVSQFDSVALYETEKLRLIGLLRPRNRASIAAALVTESCSIRFSPDSRFLAAGTHSNTVILWDLDAILLSIGECGLTTW